MKNQESVPCRRCLQLSEGADYQWIDSSRGCHYRAIHCQRTADFKNTGQKCH